MPAGDLSFQGICWITWNDESELGPHGDTRKEKHFPVSHQQHKTVSFSTDPGKIEGISEWTRRVKPPSPASSRGCAGTVPPVKSPNQVLGDTGRENSSVRGVLSPAQRWCRAAEAPPGRVCVTGRVLLADATRNTGHQTGKTTTIRCSPPQALVKYSADSDSSQPAWE